MSTPSIKEIKSEQLASYKAFLRIGLQGDEENFRISVDDDRDAPFPTRDRADSFTLGAYVGDALAGVLSFARDGGDREKMRHKGTAFRMYVAREHRGQGIARLLFESVISRVKAIDDIEQIILTVIGGNSKAKALYENLGFVTYGTEPRALKWKGKYFDEDLMVLRLK